MPAGMDMTSPDPSPASTTITEFSSAKFAVTVVAASTVTVHASLPPHAPVQPANVEPLSAVAVSVTIVPDGNCSLHVAPQSMPAGVDVTVPVPLPPSTTVNAT